jgi:hypothetical protein
MLGSALHRRVNGRWVQRIVWTLLVASGASLAWRALSIG